MYVLHKSKQKHLQTIKFLFKNKIKGEISFVSQTNAKQEINLIFRGMSIIDK